MEIIDYPFTQLGTEQIARPFLPTVFINPHTGRGIKLLSLIDTGADECALPAVCAPLLGHKLEAGQTKQIGTGNGATIAYSHTMCIHVQDYQLDDVPFDFMPNLNIPLLGVKNFLANFELSIDYPDQNFSLRQKK